MAEGLKPPFDYSNILIGEEIIYRGLNQQEDQASSDKFGRTWSNDDRIEQSSMFFKSSVLRSDFDTSDFEHCLPYPPCPWAKDKDDEEDGVSEIGLSKFNDVIMSNDGIFSYKIEVIERTDAMDSINLGPKVFDYEINQNKLDPDFQSEFSYLSRSVTTGYTGKAAIRIQRRHRGELDQEFYYLFKLGV